jgi:hypothetical protein
MTKARKNKPTHIEKVLPLNEIIGLFRQRFHDPYLNPEAELSIADFQAAFPEVSRDDLEEGLNHWVMHPSYRVLSTKTIDLNGHQEQIWYVHGLHEDHTDYAISFGHGPIQV